MNRIQWIVSARLPTWLTAEYQLRHIRRGDLITCVCVCVCVCLQAAERVQDPVTQEHVHLDTDQLRPGHHHESGHHPAAADLIQSGGVLHQTGKQAINRQTPRLTHPVPIDNIATHRRSARRHPIK